MGTGEVLGWKWCGRVGMTNWEEEMKCIGGVWFIKKEGKKNKQKNEKKVEKTMKKNGKIEKKKKKRKR